MEAKLEVTVSNFSWFGFCIAWLKYLSSVLIGSTLDDAQAMTRGPLEVRGPQFQMCIFSGPTRPWLKYLKKKWTVLVSVVIRQRCAFEAVEGAF